MIRPATVKDLNSVLELLQNFARASALNYSEFTSEDTKSARAKLLELILKEYLVVAVNDGNIIGMIGAAREQDPWIASRQRIRELFWWVEPDYRQSRLSASLFIRWQQDSDRWLAEGLVSQVSLSTQPTTNIDLSTRGWHCIEQHWIKE